MKLYESNNDNLINYLLEIRNKRYFFFFFFCNYDSVLNLCNAYDDLAGSDISGRLT